MSGRRFKTVLVEPEKCQFQDGYSLSTLAYLFKTTTARVSGAIRALKLRNNDTRNAVTMRGTVAPRQQTWVHKTELKKLQNYIEESWS